MARASRSIIIPESVRGGRELEITWEIPDEGGAECFTMIGDAFANAMIEMMKKENHE